MRKPQKTKPGRPRTFALPVLVRLVPDLLARLDAWIAEQEDNPSRPEAVRRILATFLDKPKRRKPRP